MQPGRWRLDLFSRSSGLPQPSTCRPTDSISVHKDSRNRSSSSMTYTREAIAQLHTNTTNISFLRQHHLHAGAGPTAAIDHASMMQPDDIAGDRKPEAAAVRTRGDEGLEDLVANRSRNADAVVQHLDRRVGRIPCQDANGHQPAGGIRVLERGDAVDDQIVQGGLQELLDASHTNQRRTNFEPDPDRRLPRHHCSHAADRQGEAMVSWQTSIRFRLSWDGGLCSVSMRMFLM